MKKTFLLLLLVSKFSVAQIRPLHIGDTVPEIFYTHLAQKNDDRTKLARLRGKLLILDFWGTTCTSCIASFPKIDELQREFNGKVQFLMVTKDPAAKVEATMSKLRKARMPDAPSLTGDTLLPKLFFYTGIPHHVWIDSNGVVRATTSGYNTAKKTISMYLNGTDPKLYVSQTVKGYKAATPWLRPEELVYYSYFSRRAKEINQGGLGTDRDSATKKIVGLRFDPTPLVELMKVAYSESIDGGQFAENNRVIVEAENPQGYFLPSDPTQWDYWMLENTYGYFLRVQPALADKIFAFMRQDLERVFGLTATIEKRKVKCLMLKVKGNPQVSAKTIPRSRYIEDEHRLQVEGFSMAKVADNLSFWLARDLRTPVVDGTRFSGRVDLDLVVKKGDVEGVKKQLEKYGLTFKEKVCRLDMLVIRKKE